MDERRETYRRQWFLSSKPGSFFGAMIKRESGADSIEDPEFSYGEICERTKEWMNSTEECKNIMEKTIDYQGDTFSPVQAIRLTSFFQNMIIKTKKNELKRLVKLTKFLEGKHPPDLQDQCTNIPVQSDQEISGPEENLKWIPYFISLHNANFYVFPELEKNRLKYIVCYKCLKRSDTAQACPICRLVYFCSIKCNAADANKPDGYHRCSLVFWNMKKEQFFSIRKERKLEYGSPRGSKGSDSKMSSISSFGDRKSERTVSYSSSVPISKEKSSSSVDQKTTPTELIKKRGVKRTKISELTLGGQPSKRKKKKSSLGLKSKAKVPRRELSRSRSSRWKQWSLKGKEKKKSKQGLSAYPHDLHHVDAFGRRHHGEGSELSLMGILERKQRLDKITTKANIEVASKLLRAQLHVLEQKRLEIERLKEAQDEIDLDFPLFRKIGGMASPEQFWEKGLESLHPSKDRFLAYLMMIQGSFADFDIENYFPYVVFVDGKMYYKFYGQGHMYKAMEFKENYSFN